MKKYYLLVYCLSLYLLFLVSEVYLLNQVDNNDQLRRIQDRYKVDDPEDLIETEEYIPAETTKLKQKKLSRILRNGETTTQSPTLSLNCDNFEKEHCMIKGVSEFNAHYQIDNGEEIISCISSSSNIFDICQYEREFRKTKFKNFPVVPVLKLENKKVLEIGTKFFFVDKSNNPINIDPKANLKSPTVARLSVRLSGGLQKNIKCRCHLLIKSNRDQRRYWSLIKNVKNLNSRASNSFTCDPTLTSSRRLDANHFSFVGDHLALNCSRLHEELLANTLDYFPRTKLLANFYLWNLVLDNSCFSMIHSNINALSICTTYRDLHIISGLSLCAIFHLMTSLRCVSSDSSCAEKCVCNQERASKTHTDDCYLFNRSKVEWRKLTLIQQFQFIINTKLSTNFLVLITKMILASILISYIPSSIALKQSNLCVEKCYYNLNLDSLATDKFGMADNGYETCECSIGNVITETVYRSGVPMSRATALNDCVLGSELCLVSNNQAQNLFACRNGCNSLASIKNIPNTKFNKFYKGKSFKGNLTSLKIANRLRDGNMDSPIESKILEEESIKEYKFYKSLKVDDVPPENLMPRQSLVFSTEVDGKYRYLLEMDIKANTGSVYLLSDDAAHSPMEFMVYVKSVGVEYDVRYKYSTAKIDTTVADYLVTCTGNCADCVKQKPKVGVLDFCVTPTSWWGCEELGCLAINEGSICGHCTNIYDLSSLVNIYQVVESHVTAEICIKSLDGYTCKKHSDRSPIQTDYYQLDMSIDLHNDYMSTDKLFAVTKQQKILTGNIADLGDFSGSSFGHPQITIDGVPLSVPATFVSKDFYPGVVVLLGIKKVFYKAMWAFTHTVPILKSLSSIPKNVIFTLDEEYVTQLSMGERIFLVGEIDNIVIDIAQGNCFKKIPTKALFLSEVKMNLFRLCSKLLQEIDCNITYTSEHYHFHQDASWIPASFKFKSIGNISRSKPKNLSRFIALKKSQTNLSSKSLRIKKNEQWTFRWMSLLKLIKDTIIHFDDKSAHDEKIHHSDTSISSLWDWIKAPFNWVASFFGTFFDLVRIILVITAACIGLYILSSIFRLSKTYYADRRRQKLEDAIESIESSVLLTNYTGVDQARKRKSPPKGYDFSLDI
uniref:Envelopment polyprotein n=1 Tax=Watermelon bud necrosis virus TaxID=76052 RepID=C0LE07_9VIRU|nr:glycoprotein [Watermelon bud necrosis virus]